MATTPALVPALPSLAPRPLAGRLGLDLPPDWWPTRSGVKAWEAAGFGWLQVHAPPVEVLCDWRAAVCHATALRQTLATTPLELALHAPRGLRPSGRAAGRELAALLDYASELGAGLVVCHALDLPAGSPRDLLAAEEVVLAVAVRRAEELGITLALENLAPAWPGRPRVAHDLAAVHALVQRRASARLRLCLDVAHAHLAADTAHIPLADLLAPVLDEVVLFHLHDNLGARRGGPEPPGLPPLRLDLHLPPGAGTLPWAEIRGLLAPHRAPLVVEAGPPNRPAPLALATVASELLLRAR